MFIAILKTLAAAAVISFVSWLSHKKVGIAGFLTALPLTTLLALAFSQLQWKDSAQSVTYAKSVFIAVPLSLSFFIPFLVAEKFNLNFWTCYGLGLVLLTGSYFLHTSIFE